MGAPSFRQLSAGHLGRAPMGRTRLPWMLEGCSEVPGSCGGEVGVRASRLAGEPRPEEPTMEAEAAVRTSIPEGLAPEVRAPATSTSRIGGGQAIIL
eukprot:5115161-Pyramimonas_sp.AAC.1